LEGREYIVRNNDIFDNDGNGIEAGASEDVVVVGNRIRDNGDGQFGIGKDEHEHGIELAGIARDWQIVDNELARNDTAGVHFGQFAARVVVSRCDFRDNGDAPILSSASPPTIDSFDGTSLTGTSTGPGTVEIYDVDPATQTYLFVTTASSDGAWSVTLDSPLEAVAATLTTDNGTSEMSPSRTP
jgi:hypothetical protein